VRKTTPIRCLRLSSVRSIHDPLPRCFLRHDVLAICERDAVAALRITLIANKRAGDPNVGEFSDAVVLNSFGDVAEDLSGL
jgi:hypothetical protein